MARLLALISVFAAAVTAEEASSATKPHVPVYPDPKSTLFFQSFEDGGFGPFELSGQRDYVGQPVEIAGPRLVLGDKQENEQGILLKSPAKKYGVAATFERAITADTTADELVFQYQVRLQDGLQCGGSYLKYLNVTAPGFHATELDNKTPYVIMFGPDRCGETDKIHLIIRRKNPVTGLVSEHHMQKAPPIASDTVPHLYTLILRGPKRDSLNDESSQTGRGAEFVVLLDETELIRGQLSDPSAFSPPLQPPALIPDPDDKKPLNWVDDAKIPDPAASKPADWDESQPEFIPDDDASMPVGWLEDEPDHIPDPSVHKPEEWDDDEDGEWEAAMIANPACVSAPGCGPWVRPTKKNPLYKGTWKAPLIDNPAYIGEWRPRRIKNPAYFELETPSSTLASVLLGDDHTARIGGVAIEVWTMQGGILLTDFLVSTSSADASRVAEGRWRHRNEFATKHRDTLAELDSLANAKKAAEAPGATFLTKATFWLHLARVTAYNNPWKSIGAVVAVTVPMVLMLWKVCCRGVILSGGLTDAEDDMSDEEMIAALRKLREKADRKAKRFAAMKEKQRLGLPVSEADMKGDSSDDEDDEVEGAGVGDGEGKEGDDDADSEDGGAPAATAASAASKSSPKPASATRGRSPASRNAHSHSHSHGHDHSHSHGHSHGHEDLDDNDDRGHADEEPLLLAQANAQKAASAATGGKAKAKAAQSPSRNAAAAAPAPAVGLRKRRQA